MKPENEVNIVRVNDQRFKRPYVFRVNLPSNGFLYGGKFPAGEVYISPMTAAEEALLSSNKSDKVSVIDLICKRCIVECPVNYDDLLVSDTFFLLLCLRNISYGSSYQFNMRCQHCGTSYVKMLVIPNGLNMTFLTEEDDCEPYEIKLPMSGDTIGFRLLRNKDEDSIRRYTKNMYQRSASESDPSYCYRLAIHIETINGEKKDALQRLAYVENMIAADVSYLKRSIQERDFGVNLMLSGECPACGHAFEEMLPFDKNFFQSQSHLQT